MSKYYLIRFKYEYYCQDYEWTSETVLVNILRGEGPFTFNYACEKIMNTGKYYHAKDFENLTIE